MPKWSPKNQHCKKLLNVSQAMCPPRHSDQMSQRSQVCRAALYVISKSTLSESVTRSPIELFWTAFKTSSQTGESPQLLVETYFDSKHISLFMKNIKPY